MHVYLVHATRITSQGLMAEFGGASECYRVTWGKGRDRPFRGACALLEMLWRVVLYRSLFNSIRF